MLVPGVPRGVPPHVHMLHACVSSLRASAVEDLHNSVFVHYSSPTKTAMQGLRSAACTACSDQLPHGIGSPRVA